VVLGRRYRGIESLFEGADHLFHRREKRFGGLGELKDFLADVWSLRGRYDVLLDLQNNRRSRALLSLAFGRRNRVYSF